MTNPQSGVIRPPQTDTQVINQKLGPYLHFLQMNGIPTPAKAELRILLYTIIYSEFKGLQNQALEQQWEKLRSNMPKLQKAVERIDAEEKAQEITPVIEKEEDNA